MGSPLAMQLSTIVCAPTLEMAPFSLMSHQSIVALRPRRKRGWTTIPTLRVVAVSGRRFSFPPMIALYSKSPLKLATCPYCAGVTPVSAHCVSDAPGEVPAQGSRRKESG